jgi:hypothetical protein
MLRQTQLLLKKGWTYNPGRTRRGAKNLAWRPKMSESDLNEFVPLSMEHPPRRPNNWHAAEFERLGNVTWPKEVAFYNAGDSFEVTPEMQWRLFQKCNSAAFWTPEHNEQVVVHLMPKVDADPASYLPRIDEIFAQHLKRFGADHLIYNSVMQARAFGRDFEGCEKMLKDMKAAPSALPDGRTGSEATDASTLVPNAQTYINMILAVQLCGKPRELGEQYFKEAVASGALQAVMRLDTEFAMWWDQLLRLGSFSSSSGHLSNKEEGATPMPQNMWALWGWGRDERKFAPRSTSISQRAEDAVGSPNNFRGKMRVQGSVFENVRRQPWAKYQGLLPFDFKGPAKGKYTNVDLAGAPVALHNSVTCDKAF